MITHLRESLLYRIAFFLLFIRIRYHQGLEKDYDMTEEYLSFLSFLNGMMEIERRDFPLGLLNKEF